MPFNFILWNCIREGETSFYEAGRGARLKPANNECVIVCHTDCQAFRTKFALGQASDALFFYKARGMEPLLILVELKSNNVGKAVDQIKAVVAALRKELPAKSDCYRAVVVLSGAAPIAHDQKRYQKELDAINVRLRIKSGVKRDKAVDLREYLG